MFRKTLAVTGLAVAGMLVPATAALAAPHAAPAVKTIQNDAPSTSGWNYQTRPGTILIGQGGSPEAFHLKWSSWNGTSATATGKLDLWDTSCVPISNCRPSVYSVKVWLHQVASHKGTKYFSRMRYNYGHQGKVLYFYVARGFWDQR